MRAATASRCGGTATVNTDLHTKRRLWTGVFTYNLDDFAPGGIESPGALG
jgi:hypothetical protein